MTSPVSMILAVPGGLGKAGMAAAAAVAAGGGAAEKQRAGRLQSPSVAASVSPRASLLDSCMHRWVQWGCWALQGRRHRASK